jgi:hypothetical protein
MRWTGQIGRGMCLLVLAGSLPLLAGCASDTALGPSVQPAAPPAIPADALVGRWGLASYHQDKDKDRTEKEARAQCSNPYVINKGPTGGVMMHLADEKEPRELVVKSGNGHNYIGPEGPPGDVYDREIVSFDGTMMVTTWVDPEVSDRYGTMVFVRCGAAAGKPAPAKAVKPAPAKPASAT